VTSLGVNLTPIVTREKTSLNGLRGKSLAVDAPNYLYQFLAVIRLEYGVPLKDSKGNLTSHLGGLIFRTTRLIAEYDLKLVFVFDGQPPELKLEELRRRSALRSQASEEWKEAQRRGDREKAFSKAVASTRLTRSMIDDAKTVLNCLGIPYVVAPSEAEAQAAHMASMGSVWAANSRDYDCLLFGAPRLARYVTISGSEFLPSKGISRRLVPEIIYLDRFLSNLGLSREQLVDLAILIGTDYNQGVRGIGPKTALKLVRECGSLENLPSDIGEEIPKQYQEVRDLFLNPAVTDVYSTNYGTLDEEKLLGFLVDERGFERRRVETAVQRMKIFYSSRSQTGLGMWL
jgi:flap endonuclease-1